MKDRSPMARFFAEHRPSKDRRKCRCGWKAADHDHIWAEHLTMQMQGVGLKREKA